MSENVLIKTLKPQLCCFPDGLLVKFWVYQAMPNAYIGSSPAWGNFAFFHCKLMLGKFAYMYRLFLNNLRLKLWQINIEVSFGHYSNVYIAAQLQTVDLFKQPTNALSIQKSGSLC